MITYFIRKRFAWMNDSYTGWGNGYVVIPKGHPLYKLDSEKMSYADHELFHGGCNWSGYASGLANMDPNDDRWVLGFDTAHAGDSIQKWPKEKVKAAARNIAYELNKRYPHRKDKLDLL